MSRRQAGGTARAVALDAMVAVESGERANVAVPDRLARSGLDERDRHFVTEVVYGACRMRRASSWLIERNLVQPRGGARTKGMKRPSAHGRPTGPNSRLEQLDNHIKASLLLGVYQLMWMRVPPHAAVAATVDEVRGPGRSLVNAVLRKVAADVADRPVEWPDTATRLSYPDWIVELLSADLGQDEALAALDAMNRPGRATRRADGYFQDAASQMVAAYVASQAVPGPLLDVCSAPGGKATAIATSTAVATPAAGARDETGAGDGRSGPAVVVAADISEERARTVASNVAALGSGSVVPVVADGEHPPWRPGVFSTVLLDAPCSGLGVLRRRPDARWRRWQGDVGRLGGLQRRLAETAWGLLAPGGTFFYSVCTVTDAETVGFDAWIRDAAGWLVALEPPGPPWRPHGRGALLLPQDCDSDGMFVLGLRSTVPSARLAPWEHNAGS